LGTKAVVLGASGFAGAELLRLLLTHPSIEAVAAAASSNAGKGVAELYPNLSGYRDMKFISVDDALQVDADVIFSSLPPGESAQLFGDSNSRKVVDISADFRLNHSWIYGLTEFHREEVQGADRLANPGCYPAAALLALGPLAEAGAIESEGIHIDAKSGISGAGRASGEGLDFASVSENTRPYSVTGHRHVPEIEQELSALSGERVTVSFVPHIVPMTRGIVATCVAKLVDGAEHSVQGILEERYVDEAFVRVLGGQQLPETKHLSGTNLAEVAGRVDERTGKVIVIAAIDNLGKGAAGQALQNANLMLGFEETAGLSTTGILP
jgi:N-acetyl-gamma-glutamyl-phosphate reductase